MNLWVPRFKHTQVKRATAAFPSVLVFLDFATIRHRVYTPTSTVTGAPTVAVATCGARETQMSDQMPDHVDDEVAQYSAAERSLGEALESLQESKDKNVDTLFTAIKSLDVLRKFMVRDLTTAVGRMQGLEHGLTSLGDYVNNQRESVNDLGATLAALIDVLITTDVVEPEALVAKKTELINDAGMPPAQNNPSN
ncbi:MAG: hypothetical protein A2341_07290 [Deltaproteobacteria bacterium RIFOXYB12_FULL_58_9]|nr:MAG: hypothetical protein A2341_07290 [Deltaproteobacteria bacterium RIFOXYB12_FULL_58_9]